MEKIFKNKRFFNALLLISLAGFLVFPKIYLADEFDDITLRETAKYLELPGGKVQELIHSFINIFHSEWEYLMGSGYPTAEEMAVPSFMKKAVQVQALNHLLIDAPIEIIWGMAKAAIKISRIVLAQDISGVLGELEKETTKRAVSYGMNALLKNDIRMSPGAIEFEYKLREGGISRVLIQYIMIYKPVDAKSGEMIVRFYSTESLKPPENKGSLGMRFGTYTELTNDLPPFIVDIYGPVEDYQWIGKPSVNIDFPPEVPDFGIKPLTFWEKHILKPVETTIKEVEIIITKITGKSPKIVDTWEDIKKEVKSFLSKLNPFSPAGLSETPIAQDILPPTQTESVEESLQRISLQRITLAEAQEVMDDIIESVDIIEQEIFVVDSVNNKEVELKKKIMATTTSATTTEEEAVEDEPQQVLNEAGEVIWCAKSGTPAKNKVIINEIAWMGTENSANDEWIELKNISSNEIDLADWQLLDEDNQITISFGQIILSPGQLILLERTSDDSVANITADLIYTGAMNNSGEILYLFNNSCQLQEKVGSFTSWPYGDNSSKRTMERRSDLNWQTSADPGGTPKKENSSGYIKYYGGGSVSSLPPPPPPKEEPLEPTSTSQVIITEIQIETASSTDYDFIELYNSGTTSADISGFQLKKKASIGSEYSVRVFPENSIVPAQGYFLWLNSDYVSSTQISASATSTQTLAKNNSVALMTTDEGVIDAVAWGTSTDPFVEGTAFPQNPGENQSLGRKWSTTTQGYADTDNNQVDFEIQESTPGEQNQIATTTEENTTSEELLLNVVINEISWMGTSATNSADEWVELYNNTTSTIDIADWTLAALDGTPSITFSTSTGTTTIPAQGFYLLERTDDQTISDISADRIYTGALGNDGEKLELKNADGTLIDMVDCSSSWFAGTTTLAYVSMERINSNATGTDTANWASNNQIRWNNWIGKDAGGNRIYGTPKTSNSVSKPETEISGETDYPYLAYLGNPYLVTNYLTIPQGENLTIEPGVTLRFFIPETYGPGDGAYLRVQGNLTALGEESNEILLTSTGTLWPGILFESTTTESEISSRLEYVKIQKARNWTNNDYSAVRINKKVISIKNSSLEDYWERGIKLTESSSTIDNVEFLGRGVATTTAAIDVQGGNPIIKNSYIKDNEYGIYIDLGASPIIENNNLEGNQTPVYITYNTGFFPIIVNNSGSSNQADTISIRGEISQDSTWKKNSLPYLIRDYIKVSEGITLTINSGVDVNLDDGGYLHIDGSLLAQDIEAESINFINSQFSWKRIYFSASSTGSILENVVLSGGAGQSSVGQIYVDGSSIELRNSTSSNSFEAGIYLENSSSTISNSHFGNQPYGMKIYGSEKFPQLDEGITFENNSIYDIYIDDTATWCGSLPEYLATSTSNNCP